MRLLAPGIGVVVLGGVLYLGLGRGADGGGIRWVTEVVERGPITATVTATGTVNPVSSVQVGTYVSGPVQALFADFNTPVRRGQPLARIDPRPFQVKVDAAAAELANARAQVAKATADAALKAVTLRRVRDLAAGGIVAQNELDTALSADRQARAQVDLDRAGVVSAEARLQEAQVNLDYTDITSPVDGVVVSRNVDVGQTVAASFQTPTLFLVATDLTKMQVIANVSESDIGAVAAGQDGRFTVDAYPGTAFHGRVDQVRNAPITVQNVVTYDVVLKVENPELKLRPGMTANVTIVTASRPEALRIATAALRFRPPRAADGDGVQASARDGADGAGPRVWVLDGDAQPRAVPVTIGIADERFTQITDGLREGERVVVALKREPPAAAPRQPPPFAAPGRRR